MATASIAASIINFLILLTSLCNGRLTLEAGLSTLKRACLLLKPRL
jgi:hypothetical protein